jgi:hypothetical protein
VTATRAPRYRVVIYELRDGKTTQLADTYGNGFITAVATLDDDILEVHFNQGGPKHLQHHIATAIAHDYPLHPR